MTDGLLDGVPVVDNSKIQLLCKLDVLTMPNNQRQEHCSPSSPSRPERHVCRLVSALVVSSLVSSVYVRLSSSAFKPTKKRRLRRC